MRKRILALLLAFVMTVGLLPAAAFALDEPAHAHTDWTAVTMDTTDTSKINVGGEKQESNTLTAGSYCLDGDLTVSLTISGTVSLCLNGHSVTVSSGSAVKVNDRASLTLWDCVTDSQGKIVNTGTSSSNYGIENNGTLTLNSGAVEGAYHGVYNSSSTSVFKLSGGSVSGGTYGIYNYSSGSQVYLSGSPSVTGDTAGIFTNSSSSKIYADDGTEQNAVAYSGDAITLAYSSLSNGNTAVYHVTEATKDKFTFTHDNYTLEFVAEKNALQFQGKPQTLTWYDINEGQITGDGYPASVPYDTYLRTSELPAAPAVEGKAFLGWLYKTGNDSTWSTRYWSGRYISSATSFKADYVDEFPGGSGTESDPYQIATANHLQTLSTLVRMDIAGYNNSAVWYKLTADIDLSGVCGEELGSWTPIGRGQYFCANLDGDGRTISNLYINTEGEYQGLFRGLGGATVKNLAITGWVAAGDESGALAGYISSGSTVENVDVTGVTLITYGYTTDGHRTMAYKAKSGNTIDIQGNYKNNWIKTTYSNDGYEVATDNLDGGTVTAEAEFVNGGRYIQLSYTVTAGDTAVEGGKLAVHADIMIGDNDKAAVEVIQDADGQVIGLKMVDTHTVEAKPNCISRDAQFNLYFDGTGGVTPVDTYWFGEYSERDDINSTYGYIYFAPLNDDTKSTSYGPYEKDASGVYTRLTDTDSGFAVSWQNINLGAGESKTYSFILGVGEKADPPKWDDGKAVSLTLAADAEQNGRLVNVSAKVKDAAGLTDTLYYSVDGGDGVILGEVAADGSMKAITGQLDLKDYANGVYTFSFWVVNSKGAASAAVERTITITADGIQGLDGDEPSHTHAWAEGKVEVRPGTPAVTVDEEVLKDLAGTLAEGQSVTVTFTVEKKAESSAAHADAIKQAAGGKTLEFLDLSLVRTVTLSSGGSTDTPITDTNGKVLEIVVPYDFSGKQNVTVYRYHGGSAETLAQAQGDAKAGGTFRLGADSVTIYATKFSTYAIGYTPTGGGGGNGGGGGGGYGSDAYTVETPSAGGYKDCPRDSTCPLWPYTDVDLAEWYHDGIHDCVENGLMSGYGNSLFGPNDNLSRAQFAQILFRKEGRPAVNDLTPFEDVPNGAWYAEAVRWAAAQGIVSGYGNGNFGPGDPITREQLAVMLWRCSGSPAATNKELYFNDADEISGYALEALRWAVENGMINGKSGGILDPQGLATRAETAQILKNYSEGK